MKTGVEHGLLHVGPFVSQFKVHSGEIIGIIDRTEGEDGEAGGVQAWLSEALFSERVFTELLRRCNQSWNALLRRCFDLPELSPVKPLVTVSDGDRRFNIRERRFNPLARRPSDHVFVYNYRLTRPEARLSSRLRFAFDRDTGEVTFWRPRREQEGGITEKKTLDAATFAKRICSLDTRYTLKQKD